MVVTGRSGRSRPRTTTPTTAGSPRTQVTGVTYGGSLGFYPTSVGAVCGHSPPGKVTGPGTAHRPWSPVSPFRRPRRVEKVVGPGGGLPVGWGPPGRTGRTQKSPEEEDLQEDLRETGGSLESGRGRESSLPEPDRTGKSSIPDVGHRVRDPSPVRPREGPSRPRLPSESHGGRGSPCPRALGVESTQVTSQRLRGRPVPIHSSPGSDVLLRDPGREGRRTGSDRHKTR